MLGQILSSRTRLLTATAATTSIAAATSFLASDTETAPARLIRTLYHSAAVAYEIKRLERSGAAKASTEAAEAHQRAADRLLRVCLLHGGLYVKLGQFVASMNHVLPPQYPETLARCQDRATPVKFETVKQAVEAELRLPALADAFSHFEPEPIAAASLAQVHRATTVDGDAVAIKVQYPQLQRQVEADIHTLRVLALWVGRLFPGHAYDWLLPEFENSIRKELDFRREAYNSERCARNFADEPAVHVPKTHPNLSGRRVLTMDFIDGVKLNDADGLARLGLDKLELAQLVYTTFSAMAFRDGFVHCDPHPGNLLVRPLVAGGGGGSRSGSSSSGSGSRSSSSGSRSSRRPQLVLLDHGMYRELQPSFRLNYCRLWASLLTSDHHAGRKAAKELGVPESDYESLALVLTFRPVGAPLAIGQRIGKAEREQLRKRYGGYGAADVNAFLERLPRDMLFVFRTWSLVRSLNRALGGTTRQRLLTIAEYAAAGSVEEVEDEEEPVCGCGVRHISPAKRAAAARRAYWLRLRMFVVVRLLDYMGTAALAFLRLRDRLRQWLPFGRMTKWVEVPVGEAMATATTPGAPATMGTRLTAPLVGKGAANGAAAAGAGGPRLRELG